MRQHFLLRRRLLTLKDPLVIDFTRCDKRVPSGLITFSRADAAPCATRRRVIGAVGPSRTNVIANNSMAGAVVGVVGSGGALPTGWGTSNGGCTVTVVALGTSNGVPYIDLRFQGTTTNTFLTLSPGSASGVPTVGQAWTGSYWLMLVSGSFANISTVYVRCGEKLTGAPNGQTDVGVLTALAAATALSRYAATRTVTSASSNSVAATFETGNAVGAAVDFTVRVGAPQLEQGLTATPTILTTNAAVTTTDWPRTNKCANVNANPRDLTGATFTNATNGLATCVVVDDTAALAAAGLSNLCATGKVYKLDNSAGDTGAQFDANGVTGSTNLHTVSTWWRGSGTAQLRMGSTGGVNASVPATYQREVRTLTPGATTSTLKVQVNPGAVVYFILNQLEEGSVATTLIPVFGAAATVLTPPFGDSEVLNANESRIDYKSDGTARGLLIEAAATQVFTNTDLAANWGAGAGAVLGKGLFADNGAPAWLLTTTPAALSYITQSKTLTNGAIYHRSLRVKPLSTNKTAFFEQSFGNVVFNLATLAVTGTILGTAWIDTLDDGWYRINNLFTAPATGTNNSSAFYFDTLGPAAGTSSFLIAEPSLLQLSSLAPSSFMQNTTAGTVARAADSCAVLDLTTVGWNPNGWSGCVEWEQASLPVSQNGTPFALADAAAGTDFIRFYITSSGQLNLLVSVGGVTTVSQVVGTVSANSFNKLSFSFTQTIAVISLNGAAATTVASAMPTALMTRVFLGTTQFIAATHALVGWLRKFRAWPYALNNSQLQAEST